MTPTDHDRDQLGLLYASWGVILLPVALVCVLLLLTGCSATATYTRDTVAVTCSKPATYPGGGLLGLLTSPAYAWDTYRAAADYGACKTALERAGFTRSP